MSAREAKLTSLEVRIRPTFLETLISKYDFGPVKLPGLSPKRAPGVEHTNHEPPRVIFNNFKTDFANGGHPELIRIIKSCKFIVKLISVFTVY